MTTLDSDLLTRAIDLKDGADTTLILQDWFFAEGLTDGLPVIIPTPKRVSAFLAASGVPADYEVGPIAPSQGIATAKNIAVNALMAGARPEHLALIITALEAMLEPQFNLSGIQVTTNPVAPLTIVNGPIRHRLKIDTGGHAYSGGSNPNGSIGRALRFVQRNIGGAKGEADRATLGLPSKFTFCIAENEEDSPWEPLHVSLGYAAADDVVTVVGPESIIDSCRPTFSGPEPLIADFVEVMTAVGTNRNTSSGTLLWVISPARAQVLARAGYTRESLQQRVFEDCKFNWGPWGNWEGMMGERHAEEDGKVLITQSPADINFIVAGRDDVHHATYLPSVRISAAASKKITI
jgi:hypothetical protein